MSHVRVRKLLVFLTIFALVLGAADLADAKKKRKKKKNTVPSTVVIESARGIRMAGTVDSSRAGCVDERKVEVRHNGDLVGSADADSEGQWFIEGARTIRNGDSIIAEIEKVTTGSKKKRVTCGSDSDRFVVGQNTQDDDDGPPATTTHTLSVTVSGPGTVTSNDGGINCRQGSAASSCQEDYASGSNVQLTATPDTDATFNGWSGACTNTTGPCTVTMSSDKSVGASFTAGGGTPACAPTGIPALDAILCLLIP